MVLLRPMPGLNTLFDKVLGVAWLALQQCRENKLGDLFGVLQNVVVQNPDHLEPLRLQPCRSPQILGLACCMLSTIHLDDELPRETDEINDIAADRSLSSEFAASQLTATKLCPETSFGVGRIDSEAPRKFPEYQRSISRALISCQRRGAPNTPHPSPPPQRGRGLCSRQSYGMPSRQNNCGIRRIGSICVGPRVA